MNVYLSKKYITSDWSDEAVAVYIALRKILRCQRRNEKGLKRRAEMTQTPKRRAPVILPPECPPVA